jgi:hypothetical protein
LLLLHDVRVVVIDTLKIGFAWTSRRLDDRARAGYERHLRERRRWAFESWLAGVMDIRGHIYPEASLLIFIR